MSFKETQEETVNLKVDLQAKILPWPSAVSGSCIDLTLISHPESLEKRMQWTCKYLFVS